LASRPEPLFVATRVTAGYGAVPIIQDVSIDVAPGEVVSVIGPNGAGKSTLLKALIGVLRVDPGEVKLGREVVTNRAPEQLARLGVGYVPQVNDIFGPLTVVENMEMGGYLLKAAEIEGRMREVMDVFPALKAMLKRRAEKLSGGERKMLAVARVLMLDPRVLILDEPTANLSPMLADSLLRDHARRLADLGRAVLLVEQRARLALEISNWAIVLVNGRKALEGSPADLLGRSDFEELYLGAGVAGKEQTT